MTSRILGPVQPPDLDGPEEHVHPVVRVGRVRLGLHVESLAIRLPKPCQLRVGAIRVPGKREDRAFGVGASGLEELVGHAAVTAEVRLRHAHGPHLVEDESAVPPVTPVNHAVDLGIAQPRQLQREVRRSDLVRHLDGDRMAEPPAPVPDLTHAEAAVPVAGADDPDALQPDLPVQIVDEHVALLSVVADHARHPRDVRLDEGRVRVPGVDHDQLGLEGDPDGDVAVGSVDGADDPPHAVCTPC